MEWDASTVAVLIGAGIGGLSGVLGQIVAVLLRQRGEIRHQNRLLLQETYAEALQSFNRIQWAMTAIKSAAQKEQSEEDDYLRSLESVPEELGAMVEELRSSAAMVFTVGSRRVADGLVGVLGWTSRALSVLAHEADSADARERAAEAAGRAAEWIDWTIKSMRAEFRVRGARRPLKRPRRVPDKSSLETTPSDMLDTP